MVIGIDISPACRKQKTGIEWYAWHIAKRLIAEHDSGIDYRLYADAPPNGFPNNAVRTLRWPTRYFWPEIRESFEMCVAPPDLLFVPGRALPIALPKKVVATIHDVGFIPFPDERKRLSREYLLATSRRAAHRADRIITVSEFAKSEIIRYFDIEPEKISVTYLGYDKERYVPRTSAVEVGEPTILCLGRRERRKNLITLIAAYELLSDRLKAHTPRLIIAGPPGHHAEEIDQAIRNSRTRRSIIVKDWVREEEKIGLLQNAVCLVHPSVYEGFGLPVIEAQAVGTPVACSNAASLPEIAGDGALFFDPSSPDDIAEKLALAIEFDACRKELSGRGFQNAGRFDWNATAEQTRAILHSALHG